MKTTILVTVAMFTMFTFVAVPALAQDGGAQGYPAGGESPPPPPDYAFRGGEVLVSGDSAVGCREFVRDFDQGYDEWGDQAQAGRVIERCRQAGLPTLQIPPEVRREIRQDKLSETGGVSPFLVAGLLLGGSGMFALRRIR